MTEQRLNEFGLPFIKTLALNLELQMKRIEQGKASMIIIEGIIGNGKTTLGVHIADFINGGYQRESPGVDKWIRVPEKLVDLKKVVGLGGDDFFKKIKLVYAEKGPVIIYDEANEFSKRSTLSKFNAKMVQLFDVYRAFKIVVIVILPFFHYLDNSLLQKGIPRFMIRIQDRTRTFGKFKVYDTNMMEYLKHWLKKSAVVSWAYNHVSCSYNGTFFNLDEDRASKLNEIQLEGKLNIIYPDEEKKNLTGLLSTQDLGLKLNYSKEHIAKLLKEANIKFVARDRTKRLYPPETIELLQEFTEFRGKREKVKRETQTI